MTKKEVRYQLRIDGGFCHEWGVAEIEKAGAGFTQTKLDNPDSIVELVRVETQVVSTNAKYITQPI